MHSEQFSRHYSPDTDIDFKNEEFERDLAIFIVGFVQCYPSLIEKQIIEGREVWVFKFFINT